GLKVDSYTLCLDKFLAIPSSDDVDIEGIKTKEPTYGFDAVWVSESQLKEARKKEYHVADCLTVMATHFTSIVKKYAHEMLTRENVKQMLDIVKEKNPTIVEELIPNILTIGQVQKVLSNLLRENIPIKNLAPILEALADNAPMTKDTSILTELAREKLKKQIISTIDDGDIYYISFSADSEKILSESLQENHLFGLFLNIHPNKASMLLQQVKQHSNDILGLGKTPIVVCSSSIRFYLNKFLEQAQMSFIKVLSYDELSVSQSTLHNKAVIDLKD
ncbi:MAG: FHIPEP family type III secretion protein, partial [Romboutsia sp.]|nr:FHIPEP family type III secretion protein [Romboutsia sp.]